MEESLAAFERQSLGLPKKTDSDEEGDLTLIRSCPGQDLNQETLKYVS